MSRKPLITVLTSYYNDQAFLAEAISSVLAQTDPNFEYILINHASTDNSRTIAHRFDDPRIKHIDLPQNYGGSGNHLVQTALQHARGEYIKFLSADDILCPQALETLLATAQTQQADLVFGDYCFGNEHNPACKKTFFKTQYRPDLPPVAYLSYLLKGISCLPYAGNFIKISALRKIPMDQVSIQLADMSLWACLLLSGARLAFTQTVVAHYRIHNGQMCSSSNVDAIALRCLFEHILFYQNILRTRPDLTRLKELFPTEPCIARLTEADEPFFSFALAHALVYEAPKPAARLAGRLHIAQLLNDAPFRSRIEQKFGFTLKDLREDIVKHPILLTPFPYPLLPETPDKSARNTTAQAARWLIRQLLLGYMRLKQTIQGIKQTHHKDGFV